MAIRAGLIGHPEVQRISNTFPRAGARAVLQGGPPGWSHSLAGVFETCMSSVWRPGRETNSSGLPITEGVSGVWDFWF